VGIYGHTESFLGKPVVQYALNTPITDPIDRIYRLSVEFDAEYRFSDLLTQFLADPNVSNITGLIMGMWDDDDSSRSAIEMLVNAHQKLVNLTGIFIGDIVGEEQEISWIQQSDFSPLLPAYPQLEYLRIRGNKGLVLGELNHDRLKTLIIETGGLSVDRVREVCGAQLPQLEHLELWLGDDYYGGDVTVEDLAPILNGNLFPKLTYLGLRNSCIVDAVAIAVANAPILEQLQVLDLSLGNLTDAGATALLAGPKINQLEQLDLHYHYLSETAIARLQQLPISVDTSEVQQAEMGDGEVYRYIAFSE
jgi:hypothetical protein